MTHMALRPALREEARLIGQFVQMAGDGFADYHWSRMAEPGESPLDVAARRLARARGESPWSYENVVFAERPPGTVAGAMLTWGVPPGPKPSQSADADPVMLPLLMLEEPDSWYVAAIAVRPELRGQGIGRALLAEAERQGRRAGFAKTSLVAFAENTVAVGLYAALGYRVQERFPLTPHPMIRRRGDAVLMVKPLAD